MKRFFSILLAVVFSLSSLGIIGGLAAEEKVNSMVKEVVIAKTVTNNIYSFINTNMSFLGVDEETVKDNVAKVDIIDKLVGCYCEGTIDAIGNCDLGSRKIDLDKYLDSARASSLITDVIHDVVYLVIDLIDAKPDLADTLIINGAISIAGKQVVNLISNEIEKRIGPKVLTVNTVLKVKYYILFKESLVKIILCLVAVLSLIGTVLLSKRKFFSLGRILLITGIAEGALMAYTSWHTPYKIKKTLDIDMDLNLEKWYIIGGGLIIIGGIVMIIAHFCEKKKAI